LYLAMSGIGLVGPAVALGMSRIKAGDCLLVNGTLGDHGTAIMLARNEFGLHGDLGSDSASVLPFTQAALRIGGLRFMRDPTRGGIATVANEICQATGFRVTLDEARLPLDEAVRGVCHILGFDPLYLASEGRVVAVVDAAFAPALLTAWQSLEGGAQAAMIGRVETGRAITVLRTELGGERLLDELEDDPLPRIC
jgi:hydrogenase expression/formation protein HypE